MNIALITNNYLPNKGGITNVMVNVHKYLTEFGEKVIVLNKSMHNKDLLYFRVLTNDNTLKGILTHNLKFIYFQIYLIFKILFFFRDIKFKTRIRLVLFYCFYPKFLVRRIISIKNLVKYFKKHKVDIILSGSANFPLFYSYVLSKWFRIPLITIGHGDDFIVQNPSAIKTLILNNIQKIIVTNRIMKNLLVKIHKVNSEKVKIIHLGVDIENSLVRESNLELRNELGIQKNDFIIFTVSRFYPRKGFDTILKAIKSIIDDDPTFPVKYYIVGDGEERTKIETLIAQLNLEESVVLLGAIDDRLKNRYYKLSDIFVLVPEVKKNSIEGFGIVYIEANYFKLPVIGSRSGGVKIAVEDGKTGYLINPRAVKDLKEKILFLYNNKEVCMKFGEYGHERVIEQFNWKKNVLEYQILLRKCLKDYKAC
jgi:glycosyltransferase involved in cell wall biosynthesis